MHAPIGEHTLLPGPSQSAKFVPKLGEDENDCGHMASVTARYSAVPRGSS